MDYNRNTKNPVSLLPPLTRLTISQSISTTRGYTRQTSRRGLAWARAPISTLELHGMHSCPPGKGEMSYTSPLVYSRCLPSQSFLQTVQASNYCPLPFCLRPDVEAARAAWRPPTATPPRCLVLRAMMLSSVRLFFVYFALTISTHSRFTLR